MAHLFISGDARQMPLADESVHMACTSPPYYSLRRYTASDREIGRSEFGGVEGYLKGLMDVFDEVRRVLRPDGTLVLNLGDTYLHKQLLGLPWQVAFRLRSRGWILRSDSIWAKPNAMPDPAQDRPEASHEYVFVFAKRMKTYWDRYAVPRGDRLSVRSVPVGRSKSRHFASYPPGLVLPYIKQATSEHGCCPACGMPWRRRVRKTRVPTRPGRDNTADDTGLARRDRRRHVTTVETLGWAPRCECAAMLACDQATTDAVPCTVLDPFAGTCTTALACEWSGRDSVMVDLGREYLDAGRDRLLTERDPRARNPYAPLPGQAEFPSFSRPA